MTAPVTGHIVDLLGFLTGTVLYLMLVAMVVSERRAEGTGVWSRRGRLPLLTGVAGVVWNVGALVSFGLEVAGAGRPSPLVVAVAFGALGCLPAVVVHSLLEGRETIAGRRTRHGLIGAAYALSGAAACMHLVSALGGRPVPSHAALWVLTGGFTALTVLLLFVTREQPIGRRGVWVAALAIFAVSALHFERHVGDEAWWVDLIGHQASLPLALAILHQDYRFALADLFLKNAIALLLLMAVSLGLLSGAVVPLLHWQDAAGTWDPRAITLVAGLWMATALAFPPLRRLAAWIVDRAVLRRPDYRATLANFARVIDAAQTEEAVLAGIDVALRAALAVVETRVLDDGWPEADARLVIAGPDVRASLQETTTVVIMRVRTVDAPHRLVALGPLGAGRRLLSDDRHLLEAISRLAARRIDALRVAHERLLTRLREREMRELATEAELRALRAQLNPHFLFNALTTIGHLIQASPPRALEMLLRLTSVLRGVLRRLTTAFCTLGDEIELVAAYLEIEHARFEDRLTTIVEVAPAARACVIPTLVLQPIVENAVIHGIAPHRRRGTVRIAASVEAGRLALTVSDTGVGFDAGRHGASTGLGLRNVTERLRAHYGERAELRIVSSGAGTAVTLDLPAEPYGATAGRAALRPAG